MPVLALSKMTLPRLAYTRGIKTSAVQHGHGAAWWWGPERNNGREVVGTTVHGDEQYQDRYDFWYPAIRFRRNDELITPIRHKELGDWKNLTKEEKKLLYRYSFRLTLSEFEAPDPYGKITFSIFLAVFGFTILVMAFLKAKVYHPFPDTFDEEYKEAQLERHVVMEKGHISGPASYYDYEKNRWKD